MFKSKKSLKITKKTDTEAVTVNDEETETNQNSVNDPTTLSPTSTNLEEERMYMNLPIDITKSNETNETFFSPSVRVKYSICYEYDEKKFEIFKNEYLFLISKTNNDWWLCLRLDENLTFFVPASYLDEIETDKMPRPSLMPPPRPPPPPPITVNKSITEKPEVKKRQLVNNHERREQTTSVLEHYTAAEAIINDLEQRLDNEEKSFNSSSSSQKPKIKNNENQEIYQNIDTNSSEKTEINNEDFEEEEEVADYDEEDDAEQEENNNNEKSCFKNFSLLDRLKIPAGWKVCLSECKRYVFYNDINRELVIIKF